MKQDYRENLTLAFDTLRSHKLRSFLAVLGVTIGVGLIILVVGLVEGFRANIQKEITSEGIDTAWVQRFGEGFGTESREMFSPSPFGSHPSSSSWAASSS